IKPMTRWVTLHWIRGILLLTSLLVLACYGIIIFVFRRRELSWFWFAAASLSVMPVMAVFSHDNLIALMAPDMPLLVLLSIEYLTVAISLGSLLAYTEQLFPRESPRLPLRVFQA